MHNKINFIIIVFLITACNSINKINSKKTQKTSLEIEWSIHFGGSKADRASRVIKTNDNKYIVIGQTSSSDGDVQLNKGNSDLLIFKIDNLGKIQWQKTFGGSGEDFATDISKTKDGGYIVCGSTESKNGDIKINNGRFDYWVLKLTKEGELEWEKTFGGTDYDYANSIKPTNDGGYILAGESVSNDGDILNNKGGNDFWILKLNKQGNIDWQKNLGGSAYDEAHMIHQIKDGGYIVGGHSESSDGDLKKNNGFNDLWIVKLNKNGIIEWEKSFGGSEYDNFQSVSPTKDGGYIVGASTSSKIGEIDKNKQYNNFWILKLDKLGTIEWENVYGGNDNDYLSSVAQIKDGGFIASGYTNSIDGDVKNKNKQGDFWIIKIDKKGLLKWEKTLGGKNEDYANSVQETNDKSFVIVGNSDPYLTPNISNKYDVDILIYKLKEK